MPIHAISYVSSLKCGELVRRNCDVSERDPLANRDIFHSPQEHRQRRKSLFRVKSNCCCYHGTTGGAPQSWFMKIIWQKRDEPK